ncbi:MAG: pyridoxal 5'-phosphate synthase glutaminase subunit PdxT [Candidatus Marinimicrobia bacterium]|nr:pyridoxal 5'-phosphate synthase glutaminase subunit PdxT [Candidatus Neomarinimicrobiota bacterium]
MRIGVLGIQGAYTRHVDILSLVGAVPVIVKYVEQLEDLDGLIIPGGESSTMTKVMGFRIAYDDILQFGKSKPIFGTCAGLILLGKGISDSRIHQLELIDVCVSRNAYGSQKDSFVDDITLHFDIEKPYHAVFIRAPQIVSVGDSIRVLAEHDNIPVLVESRLHLGASFHPELTKDMRIHRYFIQKIMEVKNGKESNSA